MQAFQELLQQPVATTWWQHGDDLCDCTFHNIQDWTNPYLGQTLRIRMCCLLRDLATMFPQYFEAVDAYFDHNRQQHIFSVQPWDSEEHDMPRYLWYRQVAIQTGEPLAVVRARLKDQTPPSRVATGTGRETRIRTERGRNDY